MPRLLTLSRAARLTAMSKERAQAEMRLEHDRSVVQELQLEPAAQRALHKYHAGHEMTAVNLRELHDALDERFYRQGGIRHLYVLSPGGPVAQGCRIAGLKAPAGATDQGFGSVA